MLIMVWFIRPVLLVLKFWHAWILNELVLKVLFISLINLVRVAHVIILYTERILASENFCHSMNTYWLVLVILSIYMAFVVNSCLQVIGSLIGYCLMFCTHSYSYIFILILCTGEVRIQGRSCEAYQQRVAYYVL